VSVAPREHFGSLQRSKVLKPVDDQPVWSIVCFFIQKGYRRRGLTRRLIDAAVAYARAQGAAIVEAYPAEPKSETVPGMYAFTGFVSTFKQAGFVEVARRSEHRPIMRLIL
jgi:GNAT superfamily N-acetyltransferase